MQASGQHHTPVSLPLVAIDRTEWPVKKWHFDIFDPTFSQVFAGGNAKKPYIDGEVLHRAS